MPKRLFREGGPNQIRFLGDDSYSMRVSAPTDAEGRLARECPDGACSPGYLKVKCGTGITERQETAFCPYCRHPADPGNFHTREQIRYAEDIVTREAMDGAERMLKDALELDPSGKRKLGGGLLSIEMVLKPRAGPPVHRPFEDEVRRDVVCPHCRLDQSVFGLATWCADCGADIFLSHVAAELDVVRAMLDDVPRRRKDLGRRIAAKDLENCLEDAVSLFEAVLKAMVRRYLLTSSLSEEESQQEIKKIGTAFQNVRRAESAILKIVGVRLFDECSDDDAGFLAQVFEKRHPITHNLGVVDRTYIEKARTAEKEGKEVLVSEGEIRRALDVAMHVFRALHGRVFPPPSCTR